MALTLKQKKIAKNMFFYIVAMEAIEELKAQEVAEDERQDLDEMIEFIEEEIEQKNAAVTRISSDFLENIDYVKEHY